MHEPAYVSPNGTPPVPYIPHTITTSRQAYAASLHVIFKHVAEFPHLRSKQFRPNTAYPRMTYSKQFKNQTNSKTCTWTLYLSNGWGLTFNCA